MNKTCIFELHADGACWGNPGKAAAGIVIYSGNQEIFRGAVYLGEATNNIAEYSAILEGLKIANGLGITKIRVFSDSQLIIKQINNEYKVKSLKLNDFKRKILEIVQGFDLTEFIYLERERTEIPHKLAEGILRKLIKKDAADRSLSRV